VSSKLDRDRAAKSSRGGTHEAALIVRPHRPTRIRNESVYFTKHPNRIFVFSSQGVRDLHAALLQLALAVEETEKNRSLWIYIPKMTIGRIQFEWDRFLRIVDGKIPPLISMVALTKDGFWASANAGDIADLEKEARSLLPSMARPPAPTQSSHWTTISPKFFEVWKTLLGAWLTNEGPLSALEIAKRSTASAPTVAAALRHLRRRGEIADTRNQPIELLAFPRATLREVLALSDSLRRPAYYHDASGRSPDPAGLLRHLTIAAPSGLAVGGIVAARHYDSDFDLNGLPRLDVVVDDTAPSDWVRKLDPALRVVVPTAPSPVLVVHPVKAVPTNDPSKGTLPLADPVETLLDLYEMRLTEQAEHMIARIRGGKVDG
jgi:hypothetical protein